MPDFLVHCAFYHKPLDSSLSTHGILLTNAVLIHVFIVKKVLLKGAYFIRFFRMRVVKLQMNIFLTHWSLRGVAASWLYDFETHFDDWYLDYFLWDYSQMNTTGLHWYWANISLGNGLVPPGNKPLPDQMLTQIYNAIWRHQAMVS